LVLPISMTRPEKAEQPGPPVSQSMRGSFFGLFSDSWEDPPIEQNSYQVSTTGMKKINFKKFIGNIWTTINCVRLTINHANIFFFFIAWNMRRSKSCIPLCLPKEQRCCYVQNMVMSLKRGKISEEYTYTWSCPGRQPHILILGKEGCESFRKGSHGLLSFHFPETLEVAFERFQVVLEAKSGHRPE